jgi:hypothetical protein
MCFIPALNESLKMSSNPPSEANVIDLDSDAEDKAPAPIKDQSVKAGYTLQG